MIVALFGPLFVTPSARGGPVLFTDEAAFRAGVGDVQEIDFETFPDGTPSFARAVITPEFNYTAQGVEFFSYASDLFIVGNPLDFGLNAGSLEMSTGPRTWLIADPVHPTIAVGFDLPGDSTLRVYSEDDRLILEAPVGTSGLNFIGVHSTDVPIARNELDRGLNIESISRFVFAPVPEPATLVLLLAGAALTLYRGALSRQAKGLHRA